MALVPASRLSQVNCLVELPTLVVGGDGGRTSLGSVSCCAGEATRPQHTPYLSNMFRSMSEFPQL